VENGVGSIRHDAEDIELAEILNQGQDDESRILGYRRNPAKIVLVYIGYVTSAFLLRLLFHWLPELHVRCTHDRCSLDLADKVVVKDQYGQLFVHDVQMMTKSGARVRLLRRSRAGLNQCLPDEHATDETTGSATPLLDPFSEDSLTRYFFHKKLKYVWNSDQQLFVKIEVFVDTPCSFFHHTAGLTESDAARHRVRFGENRVNIPLTPIPKLFAVKALHPFYLFQLFSVILWFNDEYEMYASCIVVISLLSLSLSVFETARNERNLRKTLVSSNEICVARGLDNYVSINSDLLVPGDVIEIPKGGCVMQCDAVLVSGNCIVNESMLTGESVPVLKTPLSAAESGPISTRDHNKNVLFCGTHVIQTRFVESGRVRAVVLRTGFATAKGEMVRSILFPKPIEFKFNKDIVHYLIVLSLFALAGFIYTIVLMLHRDYPVGKIMLRALDLITIIVPPALPAAMTVGIVFAQTRLRKANIFCIAPNTINISGGLNAVCFDKTGTLTEDGLDLWGVVPVEERRFQSPNPEPHSLPSPSPLLEAMAVCHTLTRIRGELSGDPLDLKMFQGTRWVLEEPEQDDYRKFDQLVSTVVRPPGSEPVDNIDSIDPDRLPYQLGIIRQFPFSSSLQRMSVVARRLGADHFTAYVKGSPEMVQALSRPDSLPDRFSEQLLHYTRQGYRVLALAYKPLRVSYLKVQKLARESVERDLIFLGLLVMENRLKPQTTLVIHQLLNASIRPVMVTGDNILTALSVARDCDMIGDRDAVILVQATPAQPPFQAQLDFHYAGDLQRKVHEVVPEHAYSLPNTRDPEIDIKEGNYHLAMTGRSWEIVRNHFPHLIPKLVVKGTVFARFSPDQKAQLVESLQQVGYTVGMCGDGANDCGALKAAHAGISLSEAEASVASPFTSKEQNISCVPTLIREGRCAIVTSFGTFKFMAGYSITQFVSCLILYYIGANLTDGQFLYIDLFIITTLSITFGYTKAYPQLSKEAPSLRLMSTVTIASICLQSLLNIAFQTLAFLYVQTQDWFFPFHMDITADEYASYENTAVYLVSSFQYITLAVAFSKSQPYRLTIPSNRLFLVNLLLVIGASIYVTIKPFPWLLNFLELVKMPMDSPSLQFTSLVLGIVLMNFLLSNIAEELVDGTAFRLFIRGLRRRLRGRQARKEYERIRDELVQDEGAWPPISRSASLEDVAQQDLIKFADEHQQQPRQHQGADDEDDVQHRDEDEQTRREQSNVTSISVTGRPPAAGDGHQITA
ncbi:hypothetical protein BOX15_Mlig034017g3, partial [Macrostomum lignano]